MTLLRGLFFCILLCLIPIPATAERIALLIGNQDYPAEVGRLQNPHIDVDTVAVALTTAKFDPGNIIIVKDGTQQDMLSGIAAFTAKLKAAGPDGVGFLYYSGHGGSTEIAGQRENYLLPTGVEIVTGDQLPLFGVPMTGVLKSLSAIDTGNVFVISDACRNTLPITSTKSVGGAAGDKSFAPVPMRPGLFIAYATADGDTAPDDGVFAATIAAEIARPGQTASRAFELAFREVARQRPNGALPFVSPGLKRDICFVSCPDEAPLTLAGPGDADPAELQAWRAALQIDTKEAYQSFADAYPESFLGGEARAMAVLRPTAEARQSARQISGGDASADAIDRTLAALEALAESLEGVARLGGLIEPAESVTDYYNNAQVYERRGDTLNARRMYERAIAGGGTAIDLHYRYLDILKAQEGLIGAREIYADMARRQPGDPSVKLVHAVVSPGTVRADKLAALAATYPDFGPVHFEIARMSSVDRLGVQTRTDKAAEEAALRAFQAADMAGKVERFFLEKSLLSDWRTQVETRMAAYASAIVVDPVAFSAMSSNSGWMITAYPTEAATEIFYKTPEMETFRSSGHQSFVDPRTGQPQARSFFNLGLGVEAQTIEVAYVDLNGVRQGPYSYAFDPATEFVNAARTSLSAFNDWIVGTYNDGQSLVYFTGLVSYSCGIAQIAYSYTEATLDRQWPVPDCDPYRPGAILRDTKTFEEIAEPVEHVFVQLTYRDGTKSDISKIKLHFRP